MNFFYKYNLVSALLVSIFVVPIVYGLIRSFRCARVVGSLRSLIGNMELITGIGLSFTLYRSLQNNPEHIVWTLWYRWFPNTRFWMEQYQHDIVMNAVFLAFLFILVLLFIRMITQPILRRIILPGASLISRSIEKMPDPIQRTIGGLWEVPRSIWLVLVCTLLLQIFISYGEDSPRKQYISQSSLYQIIKKETIEPLLGTDFLQKIPVLINDSFRTIHNQDMALPDSITEGIRGLSGNAKDALVMEYFNGVTLEEAIASNEAIDQQAIAIVGNEQSDRKKAYLIYQWISKNISYDEEKAEQIVADSSSVKSGSVVAFEEQKGVCFDYATLYVSMCRAVKVKVRLLTGLGYSGSIWGDHAWNQILDIEKKEWVNVDPTFGSAGYPSFGTSDFDSLHKDSEVQGEW